MDRLRRAQRVRTDPVAPDLPTAKSKSKRLSRSFRQTQQNQAAAAELDSPRNSDFQTPTRLGQCGRAPTFSSESPHDADQPQDIIWDATSPPYRPGKRGNKAPSAVNISEIVRRIAPQHGRPKASEPVLQQWIGDSATIPCTPDLQVPKPKKKSPRSGGVEDLLKLAKQFDMNMFRQDEAQDPDRSQDLLFDDDPQVPPEKLQPRPSAQTACAGSDDFDFLFDGPTQNTSSVFSQDLASGNQRTSQASRVAAVATTDSTAGDSRVSVTKDMAAGGGFLDDWEDDDLLNDSVVLEMTQDPFKFAAPKLCSTQKPLTQRGARLPAPVMVPPPGGQSNATKPQGAQQRSTFKLGCHQNVSVSVGSDPRSTSVGPSATGPAAVCQEAVTSDDFLDDDLEAVFSSEPNWDDPADDDLLYEMCHHLENQIQNPSATPTGPMTQRPALQPTTRTNCSSSNQLPARGDGGAVQAGSGSFRFSSSSWTPPPSQKQFTFKKPNKPVLAAKVTCSAAEIELKKRQAMERRRQRELCLQLAPAT
ncbi:ewing's tumor-associated antigen 1 [Synchiropus picturatus]